jgi:hypothetical protein
MNEKVVPAQEVLNDETDYKEFPEVDNGDNTIL